VATMIWNGPIGHTTCQWQGTPSMEQSHTNEHFSSTPMDAFPQWQVRLMMGLSFSAAALVPL
jgi:hypothetical protein